MRMARSAAARSPTASLKRMMIGCATPTVSPFDGLTDGAENGAAGSGASWGGSCGGVTPGGVSPSISSWTLGTSGPPGHSGAALAGPAVASATAAAPTSAAPIRADRRPVRRPFDKARFSNIPQPIVQRCAAPYFPCAACSYPFIRHRTVTDGQFECGRSRRFPSSADRVVYYECGRPRRG